MPVVDVCPKNRTETYTASKRLNCGNDEHGNNQYMCVSNKEKTSLVEFCYKGVMELGNSGICLEVSEGKLNRYNCSNFPRGCPDAPFHYENVYKYPACQDINTHDQCYVSDPSCPTRNVTKQLSNHATSTDMYTPTYITEEINNSIVPIYVSTTQTPTDMNIVWGIYFVSAMIIVLAVLILGIKRYRQQRKVTKKDPVCERNSLIPCEERCQEDENYEDRRNWAQDCQVINEAEGDTGSQQHNTEVKQRADDDYKDCRETSKDEEDTGVQQHNTEGDGDHKDGENTSKTDGKYV